MKNWHMSLKPSHFKRNKRTILSPFLPCLYWRRFTPRFFLRTSGAIHFGKIFGSTSFLLEKRKDSAGGDRNQRMRLPEPRCVSRCCARAGGRQCPVSAEVDGHVWEGAVSRLLRPPRSGERGQDDAQAGGQEALR
ncbi:hypothetical protein FKM82_016144 [Ascaphus truei]